MSRAFLSRAFLKAHTRLLSEDNPAHARIAKANVREGGRHRRLGAWVGEGSHAAHALNLSDEYDTKRCPACKPEIYATHFAKHRADSCNRSCDTGSLIGELEHYLDCAVWNEFLS